MVVIITLFAACTSSQTLSAQDALTPKDTADVSSGTGNAAIGKTVEVSIVADNFEFTPGEIRVQQGDRVVIHATSKDTMHGLAVEGYDQSVTFDKGETETLEFTADKKGTFRFFCNVPCGSGHRKMQGQLIVE